jgi:hypothetical protein
MLGKEKNSSTPQKKNNKCGGLVRQSRNIEMQALVLNIEPRCVSSSRSCEGWKTLLCVPESVIFSGKNQVPESMTRSKGAEAEG